MSVRREELWGIGTYEVGATRRIHRVPLARVRADARHMAKVLDAARAGADGPFVFVFSSAEQAQFAPYEQAARTLGVPYASVEPSGYDAARLDMFCRWLHPALVLGVRAAVLDGLTDADAARCFGDVAATFATADAAPGLAGVRGVRAWRLLGPTTAAQCARDALHVSPTWTLGEADGAIEVTDPDDEVLGTVRTQVRGRIGNGPCACGLDGAWFEEEL